MKKLPIRNHPDLLYNKLVSEFGKRWIEEIELPFNTFHNNINPKFKLREYQEKALKAFVGYFRKDFPFKEYPAHLLFNMATGSGKTLIMACCILYLYKLGYRNFLFFSTSNPIIQKTKDNFLNMLSYKYLFNKVVELDGRLINIRKVNNFEEANDSDINIKFTTIHKLHSDLRIIQENEITFDSLKDFKLVLVGDEAHHFNKATHEQMSFEDILKNETNWESTIAKILNNNSENVLLEYTATIDWNDSKICEKYLPKCLITYDLAEFRQDGYSKEIKLFQYDDGIENEDLILHAVVLNQFKQDIASDNNINLKPVILFKANKTIEESKKNFDSFQNIIKNLSIDELERIKSELFKHEKSDFNKKGDYVDNNYLISAFKYYEKDGFENLIKKLQLNFAENKCLDVNEYAFNDEKQSKKNFEKNKSDAIAQENILNSLESQNNEYRAIFTVNKLNEGWDVLNLFDIVRLYNTRDIRDGKAGSTTIAEAQLIGRGARYFPFSFANKDKYKRKFDSDVRSPLRLLETLHYHTIYNVKYISELRDELVKSGLIEERKVVRNLRLKKCFKNNELYKNGVVYANEQKPSNYKEVNIWDNVSTQFSYDLYSGFSKEKAILDDENRTQESETIISKEYRCLKLSEISKNIKQDALLSISFFEFNNLKRYITGIKSIDDFIAGYIDPLEVLLKGTKEDLSELSAENKFMAVKSVLSDLREQLQGSITEFKGTGEFKPIKINEVFKDKELRLDPDSNRLEHHMKDYVKNKNWYVYDAVYGTSEEQDFIEMFETLIEELEKKYSDIKLIRNERALPIFDFQHGRRFEPDFILFMQDKNDNSVNFQVFIEPKGGHLAYHDRWKEDFLLAIKEAFKERVIEYNFNKKYKIVELPFYSKNKEPAFKKEFQKSIDP